MSEKNQCSKKVLSDSGFHSYPCGIPAKYEHDGKPYCHIHYPPNVEKREHKRSEKWAAERKASEKQYALQRARTAIVDAALKWDGNLSIRPMKLIEAITAYRDLEKS